MKFVSKSHDNDILLMEIPYKEEDLKNKNEFHLDAEEINLSEFVLPSGKLDTSRFDNFMQLFLSKLSSHIQPAFDALTRYAKEGNIDLFIQNGITKINKLMIDIAFDNNYNFLENTLRFYKWLTKCNPQQLDCILNDELTEFFYSIYRKPENLVCKSLIFCIFYNILSKSEFQFDFFINQGYYTKLIDSFWKHFAMININDDDSRVVSSILRFLPVFYLNDEIISTRDPSFFKKWNVAFSKCLKIENRFITPALCESIRNCSNVENYIIMSSFFISYNFPIYFSYCTHCDKKVRMNMIATFLNFKFLDSDDLVRIVDAGLFNIDLKYDEIDEEEIYQILNVMHEYLLKSLEIAEKVAFSKILWELNNLGESLNYKNKKMLFVVFSQLIRAKQTPILKRIFELCPLFIELSCDILESQIESQQMIILESFYDLLSFLQYDSDPELSEMIKSKLFDDEIFKVLICLIENSNYSILIFEKANALIDLLKKNKSDSSDC